MDENQEDHHSMISRFIDTNNTLTEVTESLSAKIATLVSILHAVGVVHKDKFEDSLQKASCDMFFSNPSEMVNRFIFSLLPEFENIDKRVDKKRRRDVARKAKYNKGNKSE